MSTAKPDWLKRREDSMRRLPHEPKRCFAKEALLERFAIMSQLEVARALGLTRQRVYQTERRALWKIRKALKDHYATLP